MAFNGSGVFLRLYNWANDAAANIKIRADRSDNELDGIATGLSTCITKDGQTTITANLPMAGFKHTGVADAANLTDYASFAQLRKTAIYAATVGGTADVITLTTSPAFTAYVTGMVIAWIASGANTTNVTVALDGLAAKAVTKGGSNALVANDIPSSSFLAFAQYDGTRFQLLNPYVVAAAAVTDATIVTTDVTTNNVTSTKHGWAPKSPADATKFLNGAATNAYAAVKDSDLSLTDIATNNASTSNHGFLKKLSNAATDYMGGDGNWSVPAGTPGGLTVITSGTLATGSPSVIDITSIPTTYRSLILFINGASNTVATRGLKVLANAGGGLGTDQFAFTQIANVTPAASQSTSINMWSVVTQTAAQTSSVLMEIPAYQSGPIKKYSAYLVTAQTAGADWLGTPGTWVTGVITTSASTAQTGAVQGFRITWDNVATGVFDGTGTYALYGVN